MSFGEARSGPPVRVTVSTTFKNAGSRCGFDPDGFDPDGAAGNDENAGSRPVPTNLTCTQVMRRAYDPAFE